MALAMELGINPNSYPYKQVNLGIHQVTRTPGGVVSLAYPLKSYKDHMELFHQRIINHGEGEREGSKTYESFLTDGFGLERTVTLMVLEECKVAKMARAYQCDAKRAKRLFATLVKILRHTIGYPDYAEPRVDRYSFVVSGKRELSDEEVAEYFKDAMNFMKRLEDCQFFVM